jgi:Ca2+-binding EF-hand superfamily protein
MGCASPTASAVEPLRPEVLSASLDALVGEEQELNALARMARLSRPAVDRLQDIFRQIAAAGRRGGGGGVGEADFSRALGYAQPTPLARALFRCFNRSKSKRLSFREFVLTLGVLGAAASVDDKIRFAFELCDEDDDGFISADELRRVVGAAVAEHGLHLTDEQLDGLARDALQLADADGDGRVDWREFQALAHRRPALLSALVLDLERTLLPADAQGRSVRFLSEASARSRALGARRRALSASRRRRYRSSMSGTGDAVRSVANADELDL